MSVETENHFVIFIYFTGRRGKETVSKRNARERRRVRLISEGFCELRKHLMIQPCNRKLPKLQILRNAILYIKSLEDMIRESDLQNASVGNRVAACPTTTPTEIPVIQQILYIQTSHYGHFNSIDVTLIRNTSPIQAFL